MKKLILPIFLLLLLTSGCYKEHDYLPSKVDADKVIVNLSATSPVIPADGQSFTYIIAELPVEAMDSKSTVVFTTTKGTFDNNTKTISLAATVIKDSATNNTNRRIAKVKLTSSSTIENADITATVQNVTKTITVSYTNLALDTFLTVSTSASVIPADGATFAYINVEQPVNILADYAAITFTTTAGQFDNGTKTITKSSAIVLVGGIYKRIAQVRLFPSKTEETAAIEITIKGTLKTQSIRFEKAFAESLRLSISAASIATGFANSIQITTNLLRTVGIPSINNEASLRVVDSTGLDRGTLINYATKSDINGAITNKFTLGTDTYKGKLRIIAIGANATGAPITDTAVIIAQ